ncbi:PREDICTED: uncharacterized protein LOC106811066 [Priapulus caudatus]|uniref:Uncharacterized protein LOC106811066 n=1 Tax=Priapulus caudatus TaxID=37621 RepID=A0ABM1ED06_PRICU|nr:PREDICTED: uncharacterized protein LOC106811066 [Priapulus caudatus]XP_014670078.1 PREDICTED: uncharacterized protein LOC106811066 [Priapulus caudatus]
MASVGIKIARSTSNLCDMTNSYKTNSTPRGYCLIINNEEFKGLNPRKGSQKDVETLRQLFTELGYEMWDTQANTSNLTAQEIKDVVQNFAASDKHNSVDSSIVAILSHGGAEDVIFGADDEELSFSDDILHLFEGHNAPGLMQKPKLFILQACRGDRRHKGIRLSPQSRDVHGGNDQPEESSEKFAADSAPPAASFMPSLHIQPESSKPRKTPKKTKLLPNLSDYIVFRPTTPGVAAMRHPEKGSWFINVLAEVFAAEAYWSNLDDLAHKVNTKMSAKQGKEVVRNAITKKEQAEYRKQMSVCDYSLQKDFNFNPPPLTEVVGWGITLAYWYWSGFLDLIKDDLSSKLEAWNNKEMAGATVMPQLLMLYSQSCRLSEETTRQMTKLLESDTEKKTVLITMKNLCGVRQKKYFVSLNKRRCSRKDYYISCDYPTCLKGLQLTDTDREQRNNELNWFHITLQQILSKRFFQGKCPFVLVPFDDKKPNAVDATVKEVTKLWREDKIHGFQLEDSKPEWLKMSASLLGKELTFQSWMPIGILLAQRWADLYFRNYGPELRKTVTNFLSTRHEAQVLLDDDDDNDDDDSGHDIHETSDSERVHQGDGDTEIDASKMDWPASSTDSFPVRKLLVLLPRTCKTFECVSDDEKSVVAEKDMDHFPDSTKGIGERLVGKSTVYKLESVFFLAEYATPLRCLRLMMNDGIITEQLMDDYYRQFCSHLELWLQRYRSLKESFSLVQYDDRGRNQALLYALKVHLTHHQL